MQDIIVAFSGLDCTAFIIAFVFIILDIVTGYGQAIANHTVESKKMKTGFWHKLALIFAMLVASFIDVATSVEVNLGFDAPIFEVMCGYVVLMELTSILENIAKMNPNIAGTKLFRILSSVSERSDD